MKYFPWHDPPPDLQRAVQIAVRLLQKNHSFACPDHHEWLCDCEQEAWLAVLQHIHDYQPPDPPPADPEKHFMFWLANHAYNALRRYWRQERRYYRAVVPMVVEDEEGEEQEMEFPNEGVQVAMSEVLERVFCEQLLKSLSPHLDATDWAIVQGLAEGKTQAELSQELGLSQSSVSERLGRIRKKARKIFPDIGEKDR